MALKDMYKGVVNSPETTITTEINTTATTIVVSDGSIIPTGVNLLTLGGDMPDPETIKLISKSANTLTVQRGFQGKSKAWPIGTKIARNFTEYDHNTFIDNINDLDTNKANATDLLTPVPTGAKFTDTISTKTSIGLENVTNDKQATKVEFDEHKAEKATQNEYGHIRLQDIPTPTKESVDLGNVDNVKQMPISGGTFVTYKEKLVDKSDSSELLLLPTHESQNYMIMGDDSFSINVPDADTASQYISEGEIASFTLFLIPTSPILFHKDILWSSWEIESGEIPDMDLFSINIITIICWHLRGNISWFGIYAGSV